MQPIGDTQASGDDLFEAVFGFDYDALSYDFLHEKEEENENQRQTVERKKPSCDLKTKIKIVQQIVFFVLFLKAYVLNDDENLVLDRHAHLQPVGLD